MARPNVLMKVISKPQCMESGIKMGSNDPLGLGWSVPLPHVLDVNVPTPKYIQPLPEASCCLTECSHPQCWKSRNDWVEGKVALTLHLGRIVSKSRFEKKERMPYVTTLHKAPSLVAKATSSSSAEICPFFMPSFRSSVRKKLPVSRECVIPHVVNLEPPDLHRKKKFPGLPNEILRVILDGYVPQPTKSSKAPPPSPPPTLCSPSPLPSSSPQSSYSPMVPPVEKHRARITTKTLELNLPNTKLASPIPFTREPNKREPIPEKLKKSGRALEYFKKSSTIPSTLAASVPPKTVNKGSRWLEMVGKGYRRMDDIVESGKDSADKIWVADTPRSNQKKKVKGSIMW